MHKNVNEKNHDTDHHQDEINDVPGERLQSMKRNEFGVALDEEKDERRKEAGKDPENMREQCHRALILRWNIKFRVGLVGAQASLLLHFCVARRIIPRSGDSCNPSGLLFVRCVQNLIGDS
jgi:hypothetical protein